MSQGIARITPKQARMSAYFGISSQFGACERKILEIEANIGNIHTEIRTLLAIVGREKEVSELVNKDYEKNSISEIPNLTSVSDEELAEAREALSKVKAVQQDCSAYLQKAQAILAKTQQEHKQWQTEQAEKIYQKVIDDIEVDIINLASDHKEKMENRASLKDSAASTEARRKKFDLEGSLKHALERVMEILDKEKRDEAINKIELAKTEIDFHNIAMSVEKQIKNEVVMKEITPLMAELRAYIDLIEDVEIQNTLKAEVAYLDQETIWGEKWLEIAKGYAEIVKRWIFDEIEIRQQKQGQQLERTMVLSALREVFEDQGISLQVSNDVAGEESVQMIGKIGGIGHNAIAVNYFAEEGGLSLVPFALDEKGAEKEEQLAAEKKICPKIYQAVEKIQEKGFIFNFQEENRPGTISVEEESKLADIEIIKVKNDEFRKKQQISQQQRLQRLQQLRQQMMARR